jgi:hypothetical protein
MKVLCVGFSFYICGIFAYMYTKVYLEILPYIEICFFLGTSINMYSTFSYSSRVSFPVCLLVLKCPH